MIISISGTPGTGKTYLAKKITKIFPNLEYFDLNKCVKDNKFYDAYDKKADTYDVDVRTLEKHIEPMFKGAYSKNKELDKLVGKNINMTEFIKAVSKIKKDKIEGIIVDSHLSHHLKNDYCIIVRTDIKTLNKRLKLRKYSKAKIKDNVESEIFEVCLDEARKLKRKVIVVNN